MLLRSIYKLDEVNEYHKEYLKLIHRDNLNQVYEEIGDDDIEHFVRLYKSVKAAGMGIQQDQMYMREINEPLIQIHLRLVIW
jgi:hypothetical protein